MPGPSRKSLLRFAVFALILVCGFVVFRWSPLGEQLDPEDLLSRLEEVRSEPYLMVAWVAAGALLTPIGFPASPLILVGGVLFGFFLGGALNLLGLYVGALIAYLLTRYLAHDFVADIFGNRLRTVQRTLDRTSLWSLIRVRFLPLPFLVVNYSLSLLAIPFPRYALSTFVGIAPTIFIWTYFAATLLLMTGSDRMQGVVQLLIALALLFLISWVPGWLIARRANGRRRVTPAP